MSYARTRKCEAGLRKLSVSCQRMTASSSAKDNGEAPNDHSRHLEVLSRPVEERVPCLADFKTFEVRSDMLGMGLPI